MTCVFVFSTLWSSCTPWWLPSKAWSGIFCNGKVNFHSDSRLTWTKEWCTRPRTTKCEQLSSDECNWQSGPWVWCSFFWRQRNLVHANHVQKGSKIRFCSTLHTLLCRGSKAWFFNPFSRLVCWNQILSPLKNEHLRTMLSTLSSKLHSSDDT